MRYSMKTVTLATAFGLGMMGTSFYGVSAQSSEFEKRKAEHLARIDEQLQKLQQHRSCVSSAASPEDLHKCGDVMREWRKDERKERRNERRTP